jgi:hypothetical protein
VVVGASEDFPVLPSVGQRGVVIVQTAGEHLLAEEGGEGLREGGEGGREGGKELDPIIERDTKGGERMKDPTSPSLPPSFPPSLPSYLRL